MYLRCARWRASQGYGLCVEIASGLFGLDDFRCAAATGDGTVQDLQLEPARRAAAECPAAVVRSLP
ncbi:ferredoxin [Streptomyces sp. NPDC050508]|uniref:ferredoxin n=1 Tax=Streptomyces sp. NPDC050508 TaxID=3155405 RepID=UPI00341ED681